MGYANGQPGEVQASTSLSTRSGVPDSKILRDYSAEGRAEDVHGAGPDVIKDGEHIADHDLHADGPCGLTLAVQIELVSSSSRSGAGCPVRRSACCSS